MRTAEDTHWWYQSLRSLVVRLLRRYAILGHRSRVLDAGCGTGGGMAHWRAGLGVSRCIGIDIAEEALRYCRRRGGDLLARSSVLALPFPDSSFDVVVSLDVLCLKGVDEGQALAELHRVLTKDGLLIINMPAFQWLRGEHDVAVGIRRRYRRREIEKLVAKANFIPLRASYWNAILLPAVLAVRRLRSGRQLDRPAVSDLHTLPAFLNALLTRVAGLELTLLERMSLPFGSSVICAARRA
jgi:SAM-dependent methyltransferase